jgi:hypothetical protein
MQAFGPTDQVLKALAKHQQQQQAQLAQARNAQRADQAATEQEQ